MIKTSVINNNNDDDDDDNNNNNNNKNNNNSRNGRYFTWLATSNEGDSYGHHEE